MIEKLTEELNTLRKIAKKGNYSNQFKEVSGGANGLGSKKITYKACTYNHEKEGICPAVGRV